MRILVCGSRDYSDESRVRIVLDWYLAKHDDDLIIIEGGAPGADTFAKEWADGHGTDYMHFPAKWTKYQKRAGYIRNQRMLDVGRPELVVAFFTDPANPSRGTSMMLDIATKAGVRTKIVDAVA